MAKFSEIRSQLGGLPQAMSDLDLVAVSQNTGTEADPEWVSAVATLGELRAVLSGVAGSVVTALSATAGVVEVDCSLGDYFTFTPAAAVTGWTFTNVPPACTISIKMQQGATPYAVAMPAAQWEGGSADTFSTGANARDRLVMTTDTSGATWDAALAKALA